MWGRSTGSCTSAGGPAWVTLSPLTCRCSVRRTHMGEGREMEVTAGFQSKHQVKVRSQDLALLHPDSLLVPFSPGGNCPPDSVIVSSLLFILVPRCTQPPRSLVVPNVKRCNCWPLGFSFVLVRVLVESLSVFLLVFYLFHLGFWLFFIYSTYESFVYYVS